MKLMHYHDCYIKRYISFDVLHIVKYHDVYNENNVELSMSPWCMNMSINTTDDGI